MLLIAGCSCSGPRPLSSPRELTNTDSRYRRSVLLHHTHSLPHTHTHAHTHTLTHSHSQAAETAGTTPQQLCDRVSGKFKVCLPTQHNCCLQFCLFVFVFMQHLFDVANISYTHYVRTTERAHIDTVHNFWVKVSLSTSQHFHSSILNLGRPIVGWGSFKNLFLNSVIWLVEIVVLPECSETGGPHIQRELRWMVLCSGWSLPVPIPGHRWNGTGYKGTTWFHSSGCGQHFLGFRGNGSRGGMGVWGKLHVPAVLIPWQATGMDWFQTTSYEQLSHQIYPLVTFDLVSAVVPESSRQQVHQWLLHETNSDLSVSRPHSRLHWGVPVPYDNTQTVKT